MNLDEITDRFRERQSVHEQLLDEGLFTLKKALAGEQIRVHSITSRLKTLGSFINKAKKKQLTDPINDMHDIAGIRIVCLFLSDVERIGDLIRNCFHILSEDNKIEGTNASSFGYMSVHFDVTMKHAHQGPRYDPIAGIPFEIQVRTIAMDAWANVSHHLDYKSDKDVPSELRKDFYALSGLFYVADKHFELFYDTSRNSQARMAELYAKPNERKKSEQEINFDSLKAYLASKFPARKRSDLTGISELVDELLAAGFRSIGDVDRMLDSSSEAFVRCERDLLLANELTDVGVVRISANIANDEFLRIYAVKSHWLGETERLKFIECRKYLK